MPDAADVTYTQYVVFRANDAVPPSVAADVEAVLDQAAAKGVTTRGSYDVAGYRADADLMVWLLAPSADDLQETYRRLRRAAAPGGVQPVWSAVGVHRAAEFNAEHVPAFLAGEPPRRYLCVYPYVRSLEWYALPAEERSAMLAEHGRLAHPFADVRANTVASFGLGDYEWLLAFEADEPDRIVDLMRALRAARARLHTRIEVPFYFGVRKPPAEVLTGLG